MASTLLTSYLTAPIPTSLETASKQTRSATATPSPNTNTLSPTTAIGIGVAASVVGTVILLTATLFIYRCWKVRQSPSVRYYEQARLWKGFTPATPNTARTTLVESKMADIYFAELRSPGTPGWVLSPGLDGQGRAVPGTPDTPRVPHTGRAA